MEKIINPYQGAPEYNCFGCSPNNSFGLQMSFYKDDDQVISEWEPKERFAGYKNVLHGGIISVMVDEIAAWTVTALLQKTAVTSKLEVKFLKPIFINKGNIKLISKITEQNRRLVTMDVRVFNAENQLCTEGKAIYFIVDLKKSENPVF